MATYAELRTFQGSVAGQDLVNRIESALAVATSAILVGPPSPTAQRAHWCYDVARSPGRWGDYVFVLLVGLNSNLTIAQLGAMTDAEIQASVDDLVAGLVEGFAQSLAAGP